MPLPAAGAGAAAVTAAAEVVQQLVGDAFIERLCPNDWKGDPYLCSEPSGGGTASTSTSTSTSTSSSRSAEAEEARMTMPPVTWKLRTAGECESSYKPTSTCSNSTRSELDAWVGQVYLE